MSFELHDSPQESTATHLSENEGLFGEAYNLLLQRQPKDYARLSAAPNAIGELLGNLELFDPSSMKTGVEIDENPMKTGVEIDEKLRGNDSVIAENPVLHALTPENSLAAFRSGIENAWSSLGLPTDDNAGRLLNTDNSFSLGADKEFFKKFNKQIREKVDESLLPEKKQKVEQLIQKLPESEREKFKKDMEDFEKRQPPVSAAERSRFYHEIGRLLEATGDQPLTQTERTKLAEQLMHNAAHPTDIDQGQHRTCNVSTVEVRTYSREPSAAAKLVVDMATTGKFVSKNGTEVKLDAKSMKPDFEARNPDQKPGDGSRNYASQIFQVTAVNLELQKSGFHDKLRALHYQLGQVRYEQGEPSTRKDPNDPTGRRLLNPTGERLVEVNSGNEVVLGYDPVRRPGLSCDQLNDLSNEISRSDEPEQAVIENKGESAGKDTIKVSSEKELKDKLADMKAKGQLPAIIMVDAGNQPFWGDGGKYNAPSKDGGDHGWHVVTVTDFDPATGRASVDNQWGNAKDHLGGGSISIGDLYLATNEAGSEENIKVFARDVEAERQSGNINTGKQLELLRQKKIAGTLTDKEYEEAIDKTMKEARDRWKQPGNKESEGSQKQAEAHYENIKKQINANKGGKASGEVLF
ncbi:MAG TPA: hypothetical protein V6D17_01385 [Candidatus Obscuribacterales bacterium]